MTLLWIPAPLGAAASLGLVVLITGLAQVFSRAPRLVDRAEPVTTESLTVVVPAYNEATNIGPCISSVLRSQSPCADWQVLLVDDDSTDATLAVARQAAQACSRPAPDRAASAGCCSSTPTCGCKQQPCSGP